MQRKGPPDEKPFLAIGEEPAVCFFVAREQASPAATPTPGLHSSMPGQCPGPFILGKTSLKRWQGGGWGGRLAHWLTPRGVSGKYKLSQCELAAG